MAVLSARQTVHFIGQDASAGKVVFAVDCMLSEKHERRSPATEFEVEDGQTVSDHITVKPFSLHLQGIISDAPLSLLSVETAVGIATGLAGKFIPLAGKGAPAIALAPAIAMSTPLGNLIDNPEARRSYAAYQQLLNLQGAKAPVTVVTSLHSYVNMWIANLSAPRDGKTGRELIFDLDLTELLLVESETLADTKFADPNNATKKSELGNQNAAESEAAKAARAGRNAGFNLPDKAAAAAGVK